MLLFMNAYSSPPLQSSNRCNFGSGTDTMQQHRMVFTDAMQQHRMVFTDAMQQHRMVFTDTFLGSH